MVQKSVFISLKVILGSLVVFLSLIIAGLWWTAPPRVTIPVPGEFMQPGVHVSCAQVVCHYFQGYTTTVTETQAYTLLRTNGWTCTQISPSRDDRYTIDSPYYQCEHKAFPRGDAYVAIDPKPNPSKGVKLYLYVEW